VSVAAFSHFGPERTGAAEALHRGDPSTTRDVHAQQPSLRLAQGGFERLERTMLDSSQASNRHLSGSYFS
jgi:hypothetical protein